MRLLQMGKATSFTDMVTELKLVHDFEHISAVTPGLLHYSSFSSFDFYLERNEKSESEGNENTFW